MKSLLNLLSSISFLLVSILISAIVILPLKVYVIRDIAYLFEVDMITNLPEKSLYGILLVFGVMMVKFSINDQKQLEEIKDQTTSESILDYLKRSINYLIGLSFIWFGAYVVHFFIF